MPNNIINLADDFSRYPAGRYETDGPNSGQRFRERFLVPSLLRDEPTIIKLDGTRGYGSSFLEEAFGGLVREGYSVAKINSIFTFESSDESLVMEIRDYIEHGGEDDTT